MTIYIIFHYFVYSFFIHCIVRSKTIILIRGQLINKSRVTLITLWICVYFSSHLTSSRSVWEVLWFFIAKDRWGVGGGERSEGETLALEMHCAGMETRSSQEAWFVFLGEGVGGCRLWLGMCSPNFSPLVPSWRVFPSLIFITGLWVWGVTLCLISSPFDLTVWYVLGVLRNDSAPMSASGKVSASIPQLFISSSWGQMGKTDGIRSVSKDTMWDWQKLPIGFLKLLTLRITLLRTTLGFLKCEYFERSHCKHSSSPLQT